jgi:hypothetical protein
MIKFNEKTLALSKFYDKIKYFITDHDIKSTLNSSTKIFTFAELDKFDTIYDLLNLSFDYCFILMESEKNKGHWVVIMRYENKFEFFDPYGYDVKSLLKFTPKFMHKLLGNDYNEDFQDLINSIKKTDTYSYNKIKYQQQLEDVNTCGRWCMLRVSLFLVNNINNKQFKELLYTRKRELKRPLDEIVCM